MVSKKVRIYEFGIPSLYMCNFIDGRKKVCNVSEQFHPIEICKVTKISIPPDPEYASAHCVA